MSGVEMVEVGDDEGGMRLDRWFRSRYPAIKHGALQKLLRTGQVRVDGARAKASDRLEAGQNIRVPPMQTSIQKDTEGKSLSGEDTKFIQSLVIHRDKNVIALNKPAGLAVQGGTKTVRHVDGLLDGLRFDSSERPRLVHRIDKDTSGVLLIARNRAAATSLGEALKGRTAIKTYWALLKGVPSPAQGEINLPLIKRGSAGAEQMQVAEEDEPEAQRAVTRFEVIEKAGQRMCWAALWPLTGRTHQLRVHMAAIGHPIIGDGKYGGEEAHPGGEISPQLHLHAREIEVPLDRGGVLKVTAPLPDHMRKTWDLMGFDPERQTDYYAEDA